MSWIPLAEDSHLAPGQPIPTLASGGKINGGIARTWQDDREQILWRRWGFRRLLPWRRRLLILRARPVL